MPSAPSHAAVRERAGALLDRRQQHDGRVSTAPISASVQSSGRPSASTENSRPPMKRADGTGSPSALTLTSVSRAGSSVDRPAADRHRDHPGAGRDHGEGRRVGAADAAAARRWNRGCRRPPASAGSSPVRAASSGRIGPRRSPAGRTGANRSRQPSRSTSDEKSRRPRVPQIGVAAERRHLVGGTPVSRHAQYCG